MSTGCQPHEHFAEDTALEGPSPVFISDVVVTLISQNDEHAAIGFSLPGVPRVNAGFEIGEIDKQCHTSCLRGGACRSTGLGAFEHRQGVLTTGKNARCRGYSSSP
ncbi:hypothetical protein D3C77_357020 [compost metagenome]